MRLYLLAIAVLVSSLVFAQQPQQRRIVRPIDNASAVRLRGTLVPRARADLDRGPVAAAMPMQKLEHRVQPHSGTAGEAESTSDRAARPKFSQLSQVAYAGGIRRPLRTCRRRR